MIVTREDVSTMEKESAYFTDEQALEIYVSWCLLDFIDLCKNEEKRIPAFNTNKVIELIRQGKHKEAYEEATAGGGNAELGTDYYLYIDREAEHFTVPEAQRILDVMLTHWPL